MDQLTGNGAQQGTIAPTPISGTELLLRAAASIAPPPGALLVPNSVGGRIGAVAARFGGGLAGAAAEDLARQRLDPLTRQLQIAKVAQEQAVASASPTVSVAPAGTPVFGTFPAPSPAGQLPTSQQGPMTPEQIVAQKP